MKRFYSNGKLLITGEYLVLDGAKALAVPLKVGQELIIEEVQGTEEIFWCSYEYDKLWFEAKFDRQDFKIISTSNSINAQYIQNLLIASRNLNPDFLTDKNSVKVINNLGFKREWGFGSSSTLISNLAQWAIVDPFLLNNKISKGSGYDIASAISNKPILYKLLKGCKVIKEVDFYPPFTKHLFLIWLGNKKSTDQSINWYKENRNSDILVLERISKIGEELVEATHLKKIMELLEEHNILMEQSLRVTSVQKLYFNDFPGVVKPLGAWGGDFVLAASEINPTDIKQYFTRKRLSTVLSWDEIVL